MYYCRIRLIGIEIYGSEEATTHVTPGHLYFVLLYEIVRRRVSFTGALQAMYCFVKIFIAPLITTDLYLT